MSQTIKEKVMQNVRVKIYAYSTELLIKLRKTKKLRQKDVAEGIGISQGAYSNFENGREPDQEVLRSLGRYYNVYFVSDWSGIFSEENSPLD